MIAADVINTTIDRAGHTVLVVDDNPATRYSTGRVIRAAGFQTAEAGSGAEALELIATGVSAVVLDIHLPDIDGFELCRMIRANPATSLLPVIHLSAEYVRPEDRIAGLNAGADAYLVHPAEPAVLIGTLQALIRARLAEDELRRVLEREQAARKVAEHYNRTKDDFIAVLSHELRTPLNAIVGWVHVLKRKGVTAEGMRGLEAIERNVKTQARLISDILDVSRINSGKLRLNREWTDPAQLVTESIEALSPAIAERRIQVEADVASAHQPAWIDPARYQQIFWNLMTNAIKFSPEGGRVVVRLERAGDRLDLTVQDFGQGIPREFLPYLFDRFSQSDSPGNRRHGGLGLGMAIVKQLVDLHGGTASAESEGEGHGARMRVELPVQATSEAAPEFGDTEGATATGAVDTTGLQGVQVLVVEDDREASEMMTVVLSDRGARVRVARDYEQALAAIRESWPDVMVSDIGLPGRDGYELVREVRQLQRARGGAHLPIIALTAFARPQDRQKTLEAGFDLHLAKPLKPHTVLEAIARCRRSSTGT